MATPRERFLAEMRGEGDGVVYSNIRIGNPVWKEHTEKFDWMPEYSPYVGVGLGKEPGMVADTEVTDVWGCHWRYPLQSLDGICIGHPVADLADLDQWEPPKAEEFTDWDKAAENLQKTKDDGGVAVGGTDHGFMFLRMTYLRGFENFMLDVADPTPESVELIRLVEEYWADVVRRWIEVGVDQISIGDDLGLQHALPVSPEAWRHVLKPSFERIMSQCKDAGVEIHLHTDGYIVDIIPDLIECGVTTLNPQDLVNGFDNLEELALGKTFIELDIDRQDITVFGSPEEVDAV